MPDRPDDPNEHRTGADEGRPEPTVEDTGAGEPLPVGEPTRHRSRAHAADEGPPDLDARDRRTSPRRKQAGPGRPGRGPAGDVDPPPVPESAPLPDVPPSEPER